MRHSRFFSILPAALMTLGSVLISLLFIYELTYSSMFPMKYLIIFSVLILAIVVLLLILMWHCRSVIRTILGVVLSLILWVVMIVGSLGVQKGIETLQNISSPTYETAVISVYVAADDPAQSIQDAADYTFGILTSLDRENTDQAVSQISETLGKDIAVAEYDGITELADALFKTGDIQAIIMNSGYPGLYDDIEGYEDTEDQLREIGSEEIKHEIEHAKVDEAAQEDLGEAAGNFVGDGTVTGESEDGENTVGTEEGQCFTMFISGIDSRGGLITLSRSDVNILATVNTATKTVLLVSTPRDYFVPLSISDGVCDKLTHAGIYGIDVCVDTMSMLYDTDIDYYFRVNFSGFEDIVDALGGVTVYSEYAFTSEHGSYDFVVGDNEVNGDQALCFARERYAFASGDRQRGKNQMALIKAIAKKALSPSILTGYSDVLSSLDGAFETTMPYKLISNIVQEQLSSGTDWTILSYSVDGEGDTRQPYSLSTAAYVMIPDETTVARAEDLMARVRSGETLTQDDIDADS